MDSKQYRSKTGVAWARRYLLNASEGKDCRN